MEPTRGYQFDFSKILPEAMYDRETREKKARTIVSVLKDYFESDLKAYSVLDFGCSTGFIANQLAVFCGHVVGIDIDENAIDFAMGQFVKNNLKFVKIDSQTLPFPENTFNVVVCAHVYEHVPDAASLLNEIWRVLKPGGVCYFAAGNRINLIEPHYKLPLLSAVPRPLAHLYVRAARKNDYYYEKHLTYWGLKKLVKRFEIFDYTQKLIHHPHKYGVEYMIESASFKGRIGNIVVNYLYFLCPTYIWLLRKS